MNHVTKDQWKTLDQPSQYIPLGLEICLQGSEAATAMAGLKPADMEDKWFIYSEDGWLYFHRSWTGALIYWLKIEDSPAGSRVTESFVSRQPDQYKGDDIRYDRDLCSFLINKLLLNKDVPFPMRQLGANDVPQGLYQHIIAGTGGPEDPPKETSEEGDNGLL